MRFDLVSLFPESFASYCDVSIVKRAITTGHIQIVTHQLREYTHDRHQTVDDTPYGGGAGMVMKVEPFAECLSALRAPQSSTVLPERTRIILFSAKGTRLVQERVRQLATDYDRLILLCGRYEGVDERVAEHLVDEELSIGDFVLTGGELPAMVLLDAVTRLLPGVLGNELSAETESHTEAGVLEYPQYTKPEVYQGWAVPEILLSGHHAAIEAWRREASTHLSPSRPHDSVHKGEIDHVYGS